ncbi:MAG: cobalt ECF transporter T component CbiQ [Phycisphaerae bacterium]
MHHHYIDHFAYGDSPIHRLDPRAKILAVVAYSAVLISLGRYQLPSPEYLILPVVLLLWSGTPLWFVVRHTLMVSPFIVCLVAFSPVFDRTQVPSPFGPGTITGGWLTAATVLIRFVLGMFALIALASTTRFPELLKGLEGLGVPKVLVTQLRFLYRYLFLLVDQAMHLRQARAARDAGLGPMKWRWQSGAGLVGILFIRTLEQAERTHLAMIARGYDGTIRLLRPLRWKPHDTLFLAATGIYLFLIRWGGGLGEWLRG